MKVSATTRSDQAIECKEPQDHTIRDKQACTNVYVATLAQATETINLGQSVIYCIVNIHCSLQTSGYISYKAVAH